jgi:hypothetical protein
VRRRLIAFVLLSALSCRTLPTRGETVEEQIRLTEARSYQTWGGFVLVSGAVGTVTGVASGLVMQAALSDSGSNSQGGVYVGVAGLALGLIMVLAGTRLITLGNELGADTLSLSPSARSEGFLEACYARCVKTSWQVAICQRDCRETARRETSWSSPTESTTSTSSQ